LLYRPNNNLELQNFVANIELLAYNHCLLKLYDQLLEHYNLDLSDYAGLYIPLVDTRANTSNPNITRILREHQRRIVEAQSRPVDVRLNFNHDQQVVYNTIAPMVDSDDLLPLPNRRVFFVDGPTGTGKTFLFNALLDMIRREGKIAAAVTSSVTASVA
jgi:Cdc6-like AAA superfamily ATPase